MTEKMIRDAYVRMRNIDQTIPDDVLDFMKNAAIEKLKRSNKCKCGNSLTDKEIFYETCLQCNATI